MASNPDAGLQTVLEQRRRTLETAQLGLAVRERAVMKEAEQCALWQARVEFARGQLAAEQRAPGGRLDVARMSELERGLMHFEDELANQSARLASARAQAEQARGAVVTAHQQVRALELVLQSRAAARAEEVRRGEVRDADEVAARVHARGLLETAK